MWISNGQGQHGLDRYSGRTDRCESQRRKSGPARSSRTLHRHRCRGREPSQAARHYRVQEVQDNDGASNPSTEPDIRSDAYSIVTAGFNGKPTLIVPADTEFT